MWTWVAIVVLAAGWVWLGAIWLGPSLKRRISRCWPSVQAKILHSEIVPVETYSGDFFELRVRFEYQTPARHTGEFRKKYVTEGNAREVRRRFCEQPLSVRFNPRNGGDYFVE